MQIAHIAPPQWTGVFTQQPYRMALAHWVAAYPSYRKQLRRSVSRIGGTSVPYILMDNGTFEGVTMSPTDLEEIATELGAAEVILPDVLGEPQLTLSSSWKALTFITSKRVMFVPQGRTPDAWKECLSAWVTKWETSIHATNRTLIIGLSSMRHPQGRKPQIGSKALLMEVACNYGYEVHLLGVPNVEEFVTRELPLALKLRVRGVDTSLAFAAGAAGFVLTPETIKVPLGPPDSYETLYTQGRRLIQLNTNILTDWVKTGIVLPGVPSRIIRYTASQWLTYYARGFASVVDVMRACRFPSGRYAQNPGSEEFPEEYIRLLDKGEEPLSGETLVEVQCY